MRNYLTSGGLLQDGDELGQLYSENRNNIEQQMPNFLPMIPQIVYQLPGLLPGVTLTT